MRTRTYLAKSVSLIILTVVLLGGIVLPSAAAQGSVVLTITGGDNQTALTGTAYAQPLQVTVTDGGLPVAGAEVRFMVIGGHDKASLNPDEFSATTDASGVASATVTANEFIGAFEVHAMYARETAIFHLTNTEIIMVTISGGDNQSAGVETTYATPLQVTVTRNSLPVAGAVVQFDAPKHPGDASLAPDSFTATTDADGVASAPVTANVFMGSMEVTASYGERSAVFHLTNTAPRVPGSPNPYAIESHCVFNSGAAADDPATDASARICQAQTTKLDCEQHWYCWWRDTALQNALGEQTAYNRATVTKVYMLSDLTVMFYHALLEAASGTPPGPPLESRSTYAANRVAIVGETDMMLVGAGGSSSGANVAKIAFQRAYSGFMGKHLKGVVLTSADTQVTWGVSYWRYLFGSSVPMVVSADFEAARAHRDAVSNEKAGRDIFTYGHALTWGEDGFLGMGGYRDYKPISPGIAPITSQDTFISEVTDLSVNGTIVTVIPTLDEIGGLSVWLPTQRILIPCDLFGPYLPPIAPLNGRYISIDHALATLDYYRGLGAEYLLWQHGDYVSGAQNVYNALTVQYDALNYIRSETLRYISYGYDLDDIVTVVQLRSDLANSPYCQPWLQDVASIVRAVYHDYLGWYDGDPASFVTLSSQESARRFIDLAGGENAVLQAAKQAVTEHNRLGAQWALELLVILRQVYPSADADDLYVQALKMLAFTTNNAPQRNWYLTEVCLVQNCYGSE